MLTSLWFTSTQEPLQFVAPVWHDLTHEPDEQTLPLGQIVPQVPQLLASVFRLTQLPPQLVRPMTHVVDATTMVSPCALAGRVSSKNFRTTGDFGATHSPSLRNWPIGQTSRLG